MIKSSPEVNNLTFHTTFRHKKCEKNLHATHTLVLFSFKFQFHLVVCISFHSKSNFVHSFFVVVCSLMCCLYKCQIQLLESHFKSAPTTQKSYNFQQNFYIRFFCFKKTLCKMFVMKWVSEWVRRLNLLGISVRTPIVIVSLLFYIHFYLLVLAIRIRNERTLSSFHQRKCKRSWEWEQNEWRVEIWLTLKTQTPQ